MNKLWRNKRGATAVEYGVIAALIAAPVVLAFTHEDPDFGNHTLVQKVQSSWAVSAIMMSKDPYLAPVQEQLKICKQYGLTPYAEFKDFGTGSQLNDYNCL